MTVRLGSRWIALFAIGSALSVGGIIAACGSDHADTAAEDAGTASDSPSASNSPETGAIGVPDASPFNPLCGDASASADIDCTNKCGPVRDLCSGKVKECGGCANAVAPDGGNGGVQACNLDTNTCGAPKITCADLGAECGTVKNSCGVFLDCPDGPTKGCPAGKECDPDTLKCRDCQQVTCADLGIECGSAWLGCGPNTPDNFTDCGQCPNDAQGNPQVCNGTFHKCEPKCTPKTASEICTAAKTKQGVECGQISDGCGGLVNCDSVQGFGCTNGQQCGTNGIGNRCGPPLVPDECTALGRNCGSLQSVCGGTVNCGDCPSGQVCNTNGVCGPACSPKTCADYKEFACGKFDDGCGSTITCGCAGGGVCDDKTNTCCNATTCNATYPGECGNGLPNLCGQNNLNCSTCAGGSVCTVDGGASPAQSSPLPGLCCTPHATTFYSNNNQCGTQIPDGCGGKINVSCPAGQFCVDNATGSPGLKPANGVIGSCCTNTNTCASDVAPSCAPIVNSCYPSLGGTIGCNSLCTGGTSCVNSVCCQGAPACAGNGGVGGECNVTHNPVDPGCGSSRTCTCNGTERCWCGNHACTASDGPGVCKNPLSCSSPQYSNKCGTGLDNGVGGTIDCNCGNGHTCSSTTPGTTGVCQCNNPTKVPYTCNNVPNGPNTGGDACGTFDNGCGGTLTCNCTGGKVCDTANNPNTCCSPTACPTPALGSACGQISNGCGGNNSCGCPNPPLSRFTCTAGTCQCTPDTCRGRTGPQPDGCGGTLDCGG